MNVFRTDAAIRPRQLFLATVAAPAGASATLDVPSGVVKLNREFDVSASGGTTILLDFDGDQSVHQTGNGRYMMSPVIGVVSVQ